MITPVNELLLDLVRWDDRQNQNLDLYIEWWLSYPEDREEGPYKVEFDPATGRGELVRGTTVIGAFRLVNENDYRLEWIRSVTDSELLGSFSMERLND